MLSQGIVTEIETAQLPNKAYIVQFERCVCTKKNFAIQKEFISESKQQKMQYRKDRITGLKISIRATEKCVYCLDYFYFTSRYGLPKLNAIVLIDLK